jgi:DNA-3-methyladenine glycosylase
MCARALPLPLTRAALPADTVTLARWLIGKLVVRLVENTLITGRIVETEAYLPDDAAAHSFRGLTPRNKSLFLRRGHAYVYLAYGTSFMLNVSSERAGVGAGVLVRAVEPLAGIAFMEARRGTTRLRDLARGPGRLAQAFAIDLALDGHDLCAPGPLFLSSDGVRVTDIGASPRIGITRNAAALLRFYARGSAFVSGPRALNG